jgi:hypothetical protein
MLRKSRHFVGIGPAASPGVPINCRQGIPYMASPNQSSASGSPQPAEYPARDHHQLAAVHHQSAAHHHRLAAENYDRGDPLQAARHASEAHEHGELAYLHDAWAGRPPRM